MHKDQQTFQLHDIEFRIVYSRRRTLGISVLPDSSVVVRAPYRASLRTIGRIVGEKAAWIIKHRENYRQRSITKLNSAFTPGELHLFRGREYTLNIMASGKSYVHFKGDRIEIGIVDPADNQAVRRMLYRGYTLEASRVFPEIMGRVLKKFENYNLKPAGLVIRSMRSRWGSCSAKGKITLSTELIKLPDIYIEYVIIHELCHLRHHNHGKEYYELLTELFPDWKKTRKSLRDYVH